MAGPFIQAALICERVLEEKDGTLSALRIIDKVTSAEPPTDEKPALLLCHALTMMKWGDFNGDVVLTVEIENPSGERTEVLRTQGPVQAHPKGGANVYGPLALAFKRTGTFWAVFLLNQREISRVPLDVQTPSESRVET